MTERGSKDFRTFSYVLFTLLVDSFGKEIRFLHNLHDLEMLLLHTRYCTPVTAHPLLHTRYCTPVTAHPLLHTLALMLLHTLALPATYSSVKRRFSLKRSSPGTVYYLRGSTFPEVSAVSPLGSKRGDFLTHRRQHLRGERTSTKMVDEPLFFYGMGYGCLRLLPAKFRMGGGGLLVSGRISGRTKKRKENIAALPFARSPPPTNWSIPTGQSPSANK
jgi:hypothetical protein